MVSPVWQFRSLTFNEEEQGISEWDQFEKEQRELDTTLLRESIQNSLDARNEGDRGPVHVRVAWLSWDDVGEAGKHKLKELVDPLRPHLEAAGRPIDDNTTHAALIVEDFGTTGLTGKLDVPSDPGNFRSFFFRHSSSRKGRGSGGRWGLGKLVFARMSNASCWFALTTRSNDQRTLLMGKAAIGTRTMSDRSSYSAFARWCVTDKERREMPVEEMTWLATFRNLFQLKRNGKSGVSIVVPLPRVSPDLVKLRRAILGEWLVPILRGRLVVEIQGEKIDAATAAELAASELGDVTAAFLATVARSNAVPDLLSELHPRSGGLNEDRISADKLAELRNRYARGEIVVVRAPVAVLPKKEAEKRGHIDLFLQQAAEGVPTFNLRLREDITVPDAGKLKTDGVLSALVAPSGPVADLLADAEPPAHDTWTVTTKLSENWRYASDTVRLIRAAPAKLHDLLAVGAAQELPDELLDLFWFEGDRSEGPSERPGRYPKPPRKEVGSIAVPIGKPPQLRVDRADGGFVLRAGLGLVKELMPCQIRVRAAYDIEDGDPFKRWSPLDFELGEDGAIDVEVEDAAIIRREDNTLIVEANTLMFRVVVTGFDSRRDLDIRVNRILRVEQ